MPGLQRIKVQSIWAVILPGLIAAQACGGQSADSDAGTDYVDGGGLDFMAAGGVGGDPGKGFGGETGGAPIVSGTGGVAALLGCESYVDALACVTTGGSTVGKVKVTVMDVVHGQGAPCSGDLPSTQIHLTDGADVWVVDARVPGLAEDLVKKGDVLDFQLARTKGYVPFIESTDETFALFEAQGSVLLFSANLHGYLPIPNLLFLGGAMEDRGAVCVLGDTGPFCSYEEHRARLTLGSVSGDLEPGATSSVGNLTVTLSRFDQVFNGGNCDDSGYTTIVGAAKTR